MTRPSWHEYFMQIAEKVSERSTCLHRHVGAVIVRSNHIIATGYNNVPSGVPHCTPDLCTRQNVQAGQELEICRAIHAEQNAILQAARMGMCTDGATMYVTILPCYTCAKMILNAGIVKVYYQKHYPNQKSIELLGERLVKL